MYTRSLRKEFHTRMFTIRPAGASGWEVRDQTDGSIVKRAVYDDWHRVERALALFQREEEALRAGGWVPLPE